MTRVHVLLAAVAVPLAASGSNSPLVYATYLNGATASSIAVDGAGNAFVAGGGTINEVAPSGTSLPAFLGFPAATISAVALDPAGNLVAAGAGSSPGAAGFIAKFDFTAGKPLFNTPIPGTPTALALDSAGNIYVTGSVQTANHGSDVFVLKLSADGSHVIYSMNIGGSGHDAGRAIAVDARGEAYIAGDTQSSDFPLANAAQSKFGGVITVLGYGSYGDAFVAKVDASGANLLFSTYWGGSASDIAYGIALDSSGNAYVAGATASNDLRTTSGAFQPAYAGPAADPTAPDPAGDAFVTKFSPSGAVLWSTYLGGRAADSAAAIALDSAGNVYLAGTTESADFPRAGAFIPTCRTTGGPFVAVLDPTGSKLLHSTGMSGMGYDQALALAVTPVGIVYLAGQTESRVFFTTPGAPVSTFSGTTSQAFAAEIDFPAQSGPYPACVLNAASFLAGNETSFPLGTVAPGEIVSIFGTGFGPGSIVTFDGYAAPILYSGATQINAVVPYEINTGTTKIIVESGGQSYGPIAMPVAPAVPAIFSFDGSGTGEAAAINQDGSVNSVSNPAARGSFISIYVTGAGLMTPSVPDGAVSPLSLPLPLPILPVSATVRGEPAYVQYAGAAPGYISGLLQVNIQIPMDINFGNSVPVVLTVGPPGQSFSSQSEIWIAVK